jgi:hypothetical protein
MTLNYVPIGEHILNIVEVEKQISAEVAGLLDINIDQVAYPFMRYRSDVYPKWLNGLSDARPEEFGLEQDYEPTTIRLELQLGKVTEGYDGLLEQQLYTWIPYTMATFRANPRLITPARPTAPTGLLWSSIRLARALMPGEIIAAEFQITLACFVMNAGY